MEKRLSIELLSLLNKAIGSAEKFSIVRVGLLTTIFSLWFMMGIIAAGFI